MNSFTGARNDDAQRGIDSLAVLCHELNQPLCYLLIHLGATLRWFPRSENPELHLRLEQAYLCADHMSQLVREVRGYVHGGIDGKVKLSLEQIAEAALWISEPELLRRAKVTRLYLPSPEVKGNKTQLTQVLLNLLSNALAAIPEGHPENHELGVAVFPIDGHVVVEVADTGVGLPPGGTPPAASSTSSGVSLGLGLGLSICRQIAAAHGGTLELASRETRGTRARMVLPAAAELTE